jgi:hypothetical protein
MIEPTLLVNTERGDESKVAVIVFILQLSPLTVGEKGG